MPTFFAPVHYNAPRFHPRDKGHMKWLRSRQTPPPTGINVWLLVDGTATTTQPLDDALVRRWLQGGARHKINEAEAIILMSAGFEIIPDPLGGYAIGYAVGY